MNIQFPSYFEPVPETDKIYPLVSSGITLFLSVMVELVIEYLRCRITKILSQLAELSGCEFLLLFPQESSSRRSSSVLIFYPKFPDIFSTRFFWSSAEDVAFCACCCQDQRIPIRGVACYYRCDTTGLGKEISQRQRQEANNKQNKSLQEAALFPFFLLDCAVTVLK